MSLCVMLYMYNKPVLLMGRGREGHWRVCESVCVCACVCVCVCVFCILSRSDGSCCNLISREENTFPPRSSLSLSLSLYLSISISLSLSLSISLSPNLSLSLSLPQCFLL